MSRCVLWAGASYGPVRLIGRCVLSAGASYGPVLLMGRCVLWVGVSYEPGNTVYILSYTSLRVKEHSRSVHLEVESRYCSGRRTQYVAPFVVHSKSILYLLLHVL